MDKFLGFKTDEILTCLLLIVVGYVIAKMFNGCSNNGFSVGIRKKDGNTCKEGDRCYSLQDSEYAYKCPTTGICHNLVIDDGTVVPCKNPEGVVGSSNDTYCIQGGLPNPNIPVDCEGHWDDINNCDIKCERTYVVDTPALNGGKQCDDIDKTKKCNKGEGKCPSDKPNPQTCGGALSIPLTNGITEIPQGKVYYIDTFDTLNTDLIVNGTLCIDKPFDINKVIDIPSNGKINILSNGTINIQSNGTINILSKGKINSSGTILNKGNIHNNGTITIFNKFLNNDGTITNYGYITNMFYGTINNGVDKKITNNGTITSDGNIFNYGAICGSDIVNNNGKIIKPSRNQVGIGCM